MTTWCQNWSRSIVLQQQPAGAPPVPAPKPAHCPAPRRTNAMSVIAPSRAAVLPAATITPPGLCKRALALGASDQAGKLFSAKTQVSVEWTFLSSALPPFTMAPCKNDDRYCPTSPGSGDNHSQLLGSVVSPLGVQGIPLRLQFLACL